MGIHFWTTEYEKLTTIATSIKQVAQPCRGHGLNVKHIMVDGKLSILGGK